jgi:ribosomal protein S18 acetylase RimI-like enzyme
MRSEDGNGSRPLSAAAGVADIHYRRADESDAGALAALFSETFTATFAHLYSPGDLAAFLAGHTAEHWAEQLRDPAFSVRIAEDADGAVGLAKVGPVKLPVEDSGPALEVRQLYVLDRVRGSGVAAKLMDWVLEEASARQANNVYLSVYTDNIRAQRFYSRYGFVEVGPCVFMVGGQADEDIIMRRSIP